MSGGFNVIPAFTFGPGQSTAARADLNEVATPIAEQQLTLAAIDAPLRYFFGRVRIGADIAFPIAYGTDLLLLCVHGRGPIQAVDAIEFDNAPAPAGVTATHYLGNPGQGVDPWLQAAFLAQGVSYADTLPGIAYTVLRIPPAVETAFDNIAFVCRGLKLYDPRTATTVYSDNPALALGWFISDATEGRGEVADWASLEACADLNDELLGGAKRRTISLVVREPGDLDRWESVIGQYAGCWAVREGGTVYFVPDAPATSTFSFTKARHKLDTLEIEVRNRAKSPTVVTVQWTNTAVSPWAAASVTVKVAGVDAGTVPYQESVIAMPGITLPGHALREAYRRLYEAQLADVSISFTALDEGIKLRKYQVIDYTDNAGFTAKPFRVLDAAIVEPGRWRVKAVEYQAGVYSDATSVAPGIGDTDLPDPKVVAAPTGLVLAETVYLEKSVAADALGRGLIYQSRFDAQWTASVHAFKVEYIVQFLDGLQVVHEGRTQGTKYSSPAVQQGKTYTVRVIARNALGFESAALEGSLAAQGKLLPPGNVPSITQAFEIGGEVILQWAPAVDIDVMRYEWRYAAAAGFSWAAATLIDRVDGLRARFSGLPVGAWRFAVKAIDSVGNYSTTETTVDITVTSDADAFIQSRDYTSPTLTNMVEIPAVAPGTRRWATSVASDAWNSVMPNPVNSGGNPVISYHASATSRFVGEAWDLGTVVTGDWTLTPNTTNLTGTATYAIETSLDGSTWTPQPGTVWKGSARMVRPVIETLTTGTMIVQAPKISLAALSKTETGAVTTLSSGGKLVMLTGRYSGAQDLQATAINAAAARIVTADRILLHPEQAFMISSEFDGSGNNFLYWTLLTFSRVIATGDHIEFDTYLDPSTPVMTGFGPTGLQVNFTDATSTSNAPLADADGYRLDAPSTAFDALVRGVWRSRKASLAAYVGKTASTLQLINNGDATSGPLKMLYRNIRITDGAGTDRQLLYVTPGEPNTNALASQALMKNTKAGPSNSFHLYAFDAAGTQVAQDTQYAFRGF